MPQDNDPIYLSQNQKNDPYPFDLKQAEQLLTEHGWQPGADGVQACQEPAKCGQGVEKGTRLSMTLLTESGSDETDGTMQELKSELSKIGIELRNTYLLLALSLIPTVIGATLGVQLKFSLFGDRPFMVEPGRSICSRHWPIISRAASELPCSAKASARADFR